MERYTHDLYGFLLASIQYLKTKSGGQRWHAICEDVINIYLSFQNTITFPTPSEIEFFFLLENPDLFDLNIEKRSVFQGALQNTAFQDFMMVVLQALLDPPRLWWEQTQRNYDLKV